MLNKKSNRNETIYYIIIVLIKISLISKYDSTWFPDSQSNDSN